MSGAIGAVIPRRLSIAVLAMVAMIGQVSAGPVASHEPSDHDNALKARARGEIKPLEQILEALKVQKSDRLIDVDIDQQGERWIYKVVWITKTGRFHIYTVDAAKAIILKDEIK